MLMFWVTLLAISILLYVLLDGFDLGIGMLLGLTRSETRRSAMLNAVAPIWDGNETWDGFIAFAWQGPAGKRLLVAVNYAPHQSQCWMRLPFADLAGQRWRLQDRLSEATYDRDGTELLERGLYVDMGPWQAHVFTLARPA